MPERAYIVYKVSKPAPGPEVITYFDHGSTQLSMEFMLFINVKKCWHLDSISSGGFRGGALGASAPPAESMVKIS